MNNINTNWLTYQCASIAQEQATKQQAEHYKVIKKQCLDKQFGTLPPEYETLTDEELLNALNHPPKQIRE